MKKANSFDEKVQEMNRLAGEYSDYRRAEPADVQFHLPANSMESSAVRKVRLKNNSLLGFGGLVIVALTIWSFVSEPSNKANYIMLLLSLLWVGVFIKFLTAASGIIRAKVIFKTFEIVSNNNMKNKRYYVSVVVDEPEKVILQRVKVSKKDYEALQEGSPIYVVKTSLSVNGVPYK